MSGSGLAQPVVVYTDQNGRWLVNVRAGSYKVRYRIVFQAQWANYKLSPETANLYPARVNRTTRAAIPPAR